jgi:hypothetical protein
VFLGAALRGIEGAGGAQGGKARGLQKCAPKSDLSDFGHLKMPNSGEPEFGCVKTLAFMASSRKSCGATSFWP